MYNTEKTGEKLKKIAKIVEIVGCGMVTIAAISMDDILPDFGKPFIEMLVTVAVIALGYLSIIVSCRLLEGFGDLLISVAHITSVMENSQKKNEEKTQNNVTTCNITTPISKPFPTSTNNTKNCNVWYCYMCGHTNPSTAAWCENCKETSRPR